MKTKTTHTPGPWNIGERQDGQRVEPYPVNYLPVSGHGQAIGRVYAGGFSDANIEANARLIAAAPDLLAALKHLIRDGGRGDFPTAEAAIAKAEGHAK